VGLNRSLSLLDPTNWHSFSTCESGDFGSKLMLLSRKKVWEVLLVSVEELRGIIREITLLHLVSGAAT
jgi:hypothetical protein